MAAEPAPAFQFYPKDYEADEHVKLMSLAQEGAYLRLLSHQWLHRSVPSNVEQLARICRTSAADMAELWPGVEPCFPALEGDPGRRANRRMERDRKALEARREKKVAAGQKGAESRWHSDAVAMAVPLAGDSSPSPSASATPTTAPPPPPAAAGAARPGAGIQAAVARLERRARELGLAHGRRELKSWRRRLLAGELEPALAAEIDQGGADVDAARKERERQDAEFTALAQRARLDAEEWIASHGGAAVVARSAADWIRRRQQEHPGERFAMSMQRWLEADDGGPVPRFVTQLLSIEIQAAYRRAA